MLAALCLYGLSSAHATLRALNIMMNVVYIKNRSPVSSALVVVPLLEGMSVLPGCIQVLLCSLEFHLCHPCSNREMCPQMFALRQSTLVLGTY